MNPPNPTPLAQHIRALDDLRAVRILQAVAQPRQRAGELPEWTPELGAGLSAELGVQGAEATATEGELARQALLVLAEDPQYAEPLAALVEGPPPQSFGLEPVSATLLISAALFALQSHIEFERDKEGKWSFKFKKTPTEDSVLKPLLAKLVSLIAGGPSGLR